jgi:hypothetical protein
MKPWSRPYRFCVRLIAVITTMAGVNVPILVMSGSARADCVGRAIPTYIQLTNASGIEIAYETVQYADTCDEDSIYKGKIKDSLTDGSCAYAHFYDPGKTTQGRACTTGQFANYTFWDQQGDSSALIEVATTYRSTGQLHTFGF